VVGIGETGLDFYYNHASRERQLEAFLAQITVAVKRRLPLVIHTREAWDASFQCIESIEKMDPCYLKEIGSIFHCFTGNH